MWCCATVPLGVFLIVGPMMAGGRGGLRPFLLSLAGGWLTVAFFAALAGPATWDVLTHPRDNVPVLAPVLAIAALSVGVGGLTVWVRYVEEERPVDRSRCRRCGYDLRSSPERCPECGTSVKPEPERV